MINCQYLFDMAHRFAKNVFVVVDIVLPHVLCFSLSVDNRTATSTEPHE